MPAQAVPGPQAAPRLVVTPGINNTITSLQFSQDDTKLLAGSIGASFLWDVPTGQLIRVFPGHSFTYPKWGPNDETILSPDSEGYVTLYKAATGEVVYSVNAHEYQVYQAVFSKDRKTFLTAGGDRATLWETETGKVIRSFPHWETTTKGKTIVDFSRDYIDDNIESVAFDEATGSAITCGNPGKIRVWDLSNGKVLKTIEGPFTNTRGLQFDKKNRILYSEAIDSDDPESQAKTRYWNLDDGRMRGVFRDRLLGVSPDNDLLATTRENDGILYLKEATTLEDVRAFSFLGENDLLATAANDGCIWVWERHGNRYTPKSRHAVPRAENKPAQPALVKMLSSSRQHPHLMSATGNKVSCWRLEGGLLRLKRGSLTAEEGNNAWVGDLNPAGDTLVMQDGGADPDDDNYYLRFQDLQTGNLKKRIQTANWLGFSPSGRYAASRSEQDRYWLTSLEPDARKLLELSRGHWGIENQCHWVLDVTYGEDASRIRSGHAARNVALLRRLAHNLLKHDRTVKDSIAGKRKRACLSTATLERFLKLDDSK